MKKFFSLFAAVLFAGSMMAGQFVRVTDMANLAPGDQIIIVSESEDYAMGAQNSNNRAGVAVTVAEGVIEAGADVQVITLEAAEQNLKLKVGEDAYLYAASNSSNHLKTATAETAGDNGVWAISTSGDTVTLTAQGTNARNVLRFNPNSGNPVFSCYAASSTVKALVKIFKADGEVVPPTPVDTYTVAGAPASVFGEEWNPALEANDMKVANGLYTWEKTELQLTAGKIEFKVVKNHSWDNPAYPDQNYELNIAEEGEYILTITFDLTTETVAAEAVKKEALPDPTTCAQAAEAALSVSKNNELYNDGKEYTIEGFVTKIETAWNEQYKNITFWMADEKDGGQVLEAFRAVCETEADAPAVGDKVKVTGALTKYNTTPEFAAGCTFVITEKAVTLEVVKVGVNVPVENKPADDQIEIAGTFAEGTHPMEKIEATGWFVSNEFVNAAEDDTFKFRSKENNNLVLCQYIPANGEGEGQWVQAIFKFGQYWSDDTWKGTPCKLIELDLGDGEVYAWKEGMPEKILTDPTNCAEAAEAALSVSANNELYNDGKIYTIEGYVTGIKTAWSDQYKNISFWMADAVDGGEVLQAFRAACETEADAPAVGDKVKVTGALTKYNTTPEFAAGCTFVITEKAPVDEYFVIGSMTGWEVNNDYKLAEGKGEYVGKFTFAANDEFKVVKNQKETWYPGGMNNNYKIEEAGDYTVRFNPEGNVEGWYEGFFLVEKAVAPDTIKLEFNNGMVLNLYYEDYGSSDVLFTNIPVDEAGELVGDGDYLDLSIFPEDPNNVAGLYSSAEEFENFDLEYSYLLRINGTDTLEYEFVEAVAAIVIGQTSREQGIAELAIEAKLATAEGLVFELAYTGLVAYDFIDEQGLEEIMTETNGKVLKIMHEGQVYILKGNKLYNLTGQSVR